MTVRIIFTHALSCMCALCVCVCSNVVFMVLSMFPVIAFSLGFSTIASLEVEGGLKVVNASQKVSNYSYNDCITMLIIDTLIYSVMSMYFDKILKNDWVCMHTRTCVHTLSVADVHCIIIHAAVCMFACI